MGRNSAGEGFLRGMLRHARGERLHLWNAFDQDPAELSVLIERLGPSALPLSWIGRAERERLAEPGAVYIPSPDLRREAWARRAMGGHAYSLTGVTHTIVESHILDEIAGMLAAPLEPWDALICTSHAGRRAVETLLDGAAGYLQQRFGATRIPPAQLVTIPLGIHTEDFQRDPDVRRRWRARFEIPEDAPTVLHLGRFSLTTKMHPGPMAQALQEAAARLGRPVYWVLFGGTRRPEEEAAFIEAARAFCPDVQIRLAEDTTSATRDALLAAADVFLSLSDNVQETFGLTPLEAMAAGLPCVVSDWDGYRDTVRHGIDGFRIPTVTPRPGLGADLAYAYAQRLIGYEAYAGAAALYTAVDVGAAADALTALLGDADLRARMGAAGAARARSDFDWSVIIPQYQALWTELARRRQAATPQPPREDPFRPDPFRMFAAYPTRALADADVVMLSRPISPVDACAWLDRASVRQPAARLPSPEEVAAVVTLLAAGPRPVSDILAASPPERRAFLERGLVWMAKFGVLRLEAAGTRS